MECNFSQRKKGRIRFSSIVGTAKKISITWQRKKYKWSRNDYRAALISTRMRTRGAVPISRSEMQNGDKARGVFVNSPFNRACTKARACVRGSSIFSCCRRYLKINEPLRTRTERRTLNIPYVCCVPGIIVETWQGRENEGYLSRVGWHESLVLWTVSTYNLHYRGHAFSFAPFFPGLIWIHEDRMCNVVADVNDRVSDQSGLELNAGIRLR